MYTSASVNLRFLGTVVAGYPALYRRLVSANFAEQNGVDGRYSRPNQRQTNGQVLVWIF
jgi:hypothetical protein